MHPFTLISPLFSFSLIKYAKSDESNEIDKKTSINLFYEGLTQLKNDHRNNGAEYLYLQNMACKIHKFLVIFERIFGKKAKGPSHSCKQNANDSNRYLSMNECDFLNYRISVIYHNDAPLRQLMDSLIVSVMCAKHGIEANKIERSIIKYLRQRLSLALNFIAKRQGIQFDKKKQFNFWSENGRIYLFKKISYVFELPKKCCQNDKKYGQTYGNDQEDYNEFKGKKGRTAKCLNFLAKTIENGDDGTAKRRKRANRRRRKRAGPSDMSIIAIGINLILLLIIILFALILFAPCDPRNVRQFHSNLTHSRLLRSIPTITVNSSSSSEFEHCVICLNEFIDGTKVKQLRECNHKFHVGCIKRWIFFGYNRCPFCGHQIFATPTTDRF